MFNSHPTVKDLIKDLEKGDRTKEMLVVKPIISDDRLDGFLNSLMNQQLSALQRQQAFSPYVGQAIEMDNVFSSIRRDRENELNGMNNKRGW